MVESCKWKFRWASLLKEASGAQHMNNVYNNFLSDMDQVDAQKVEKVMYERHLDDLSKKGQS